MTVGCFSHLATFKLGVCTMGMLKGQECERQINVNKCFVSVAAAERLLKKAP